MTPRGIEILVKKASVDPIFMDILLSERSKVAKKIGLKLHSNEVALLESVDEAQLVKIIRNTKVPETIRPAFLTYAAAIMMGALAVSTAGCCCFYTPMTGAQPDMPEDDDDSYYTESEDEEHEFNMDDTGARPDVPYLEDEPEIEPEIDAMEGE